jgi:hypothetical protein
VLLDTVTELEEVLAEERGAAPAQAPSQLPPQSSAAQTPSVQPDSPSTYYVLRCR